MTRSSAEIEREVEQTRGELDRTVEALKDKMTPGQLIDELTQSLKGSGAADIFGNLGTQVKDNPLALAMVGAGLAWLMIGKGPPQPGVGGAGETVSGSASSLSIAGGADRGAAGGLAAGAAHMVHQASDIAGEVAERVGHTATHLKDQVMDQAGHAKHRVQATSAQALQAGQGVQRGFMDMLEQEPLIIGALGIAVGAALGAVMPSTAVEDRTFGGLRDKALDEGRSRLGEGISVAKDAAGAALEAVREAADDEGLLGSEDSGSIIEKAETVLRAGVDAARQEVADRQSH
ncbi:DUF3618 domain-containing protein [Phenylobacterium sp.]|uniref:DUF3618 domain-containing protein n=1 Tax=Phenylobacterium sp. TaxID=1871053 RepID=UPI00286EA96E|nr:DUF3618 domain-containing protein [Phenylobacterium sp.]